MMRSKLKVIPESELSLVSGGHVAELTAFGIAMLMLEGPHLFMGFREFVNYWGDIWEHGCQNVEEDDHFTAFSLSSLQRAKRRNNALHRFFVGRNDERENITTPTVTILQ